jgi:hypothetical protein
VLCSWSGRLQWQPLVLPSYCGESRAVFVFGSAAVEASGFTFVSW